MLKIHQNLKTKDLSRFQSTKSTFFDEKPEILAKWAKKYENDKNVAKNLPAHRISPSAGAKKMSPLHLPCFISLFFGFLNYFNMTV